MKDIQERIILGLINEKLSKGTLLKEDKAVETQRLMSLANGDVSTEFIKQSGIIDAVGIQKNMESINIDIRTAFAAINDLDSIIIKHKRLNQSVMANMGLTAKKTEDKIKAFEEKKRRLSGYSESEEKFRSVESFESDIAYYADRDLTPVSIDSICSFNKFNEEIHLPFAIQNNMVLGKDGVSFATARIVMQLGSDLRKIKTDPNAILDSSFLTNWSELIQTNEPMAVLLGEDYYNISNGAVCEIEITMESASVINEIALSPYSVYPFALVAIRYTETSSEDEPFKEILVPQQGERIIVDKPISVRFKDQICKRIRILINQINYTNSNLFFDTGIESRSTLFDQSLMNQYGSESDDINPAYYERFKIQNQAWALMNAATKGKELTLESMIGKDERKNVNLNKFNYNYGLNNVSCFYNDFRKLGVYVSKPVQAEYPIWKVSLETVESHSELNQKQISDIEYYVSTDSEGPNSEWHPLFPETSDVVKSELLSFNESLESVLRFEMADIVGLCIYENGIVMTPIYDFNVVNPSTIKIKNRKPNAIYTAEYVPRAKSKVVEFSTPEMVGREIIQINDMSSISISNEAVPMSTDISFVDKNGIRYSELKSEIECITDVINPEQSFMNFDSNKLQYYTVRDKVYFNKDISGSIDVQYKYLNKRIRLKAIFRKNADNQSWIAPILKEYKLKFISI